MEENLLEQRKEQGEAREELIQLVLFKLGGRIRGEYPPGPGDRKLDQGLTRYRRLHLLWKVSSIFAVRLFPLLI